MTRNDSSITATQRETEEVDPRNRIDWTAIRNSTYSSTFEELSHYSHCKVSPYIVAVARTLCSQFSISASARDELADLRQRLDALEVEDNSSRYVLHKLTASDEGLTMLGICGILNAYFHPHALAEFFETLAKLSSMPETLRPTHARWMEIVRLCGKIQASASFSSLAQKCSRLGLAEVAENKDLEESVGPESVVEAMQTMSEISTGQEDDHIYMFCGRTAGWYAAIAEWMFGLRVRLTILGGGSMKGNVVYSNCQDDQVQLIIAFNNGGIPVDGGGVHDDSPMPIREN